MSKANLIRYYPILLFTLGVAIHIWNVVLLLVGQQKASLSIWWVHSSMLVFNTSMLIGLILQRRAAYIISACGLIALIVFQGINAIVTLQISLPTICGWILCLIAASILFYSYKQIRTMTDLGN